MFHLPRVPVHLKSSTYSVLKVATSLGIRMGGAFSVFRDGINHDLLLALRLLAYKQGKKLTKY